MELLKKLCETPGVAGFEDQIREVVKQELAPLCDSVKTDAMGNVIGFKKGAPPKKKTDKPARKVLLIAHMDEIGFIVKHIDEKRGFLRLQPLGGFDSKTLIAKRVVVHGKIKIHGIIGSKAVHIMTDDEKKKLPEIDDLFVDTGLPGRTVLKNVSIGDAVTLEQQFLDLGETVTVKALDDRVGVYVMLEALRAVKHHEVDIYAVGSVQEEVGLRGATACAFSVTPDIAVALDISIASDTPGVPDEKAILHLGRGVAIKIMDSASISNPKLVKKFRDVAKRRNIKYQMEILPRGGTDAGAVQRSAGAVAAITISIPTRYAHSVVEMANKKDIEGAVKLVAAFLEYAHQDTYEL
jgi:endoglucanase